MSSAFIQQRDKILPCTFDFLLHEFTASYTDIKRRLATDGSDLHIPTNPDDSETFFQTNQETKGYNLLKLSAMYDLCNRIYVDNIIQTGRHQNESKVLVEIQ